jgi:hypothetical protein
MNVDKEFGSGSTLGDSEQRYSIHWTSEDQ